MNVRGDTGKVDGEKNRERERNSKKTMGGEYDQSKLHVCMKHHNEIPHFLQLIYNNKRKAMEIRIITVQQKEM
jgi:hypothetical protein